jgi:flagellar protein FlbD
VILVTRLNGPEFALNPDLVERAESTPDTVVTLVDGTKYVIAESVDELIRLVRLYRAGVLADAQRLTDVPVPVPVPVPVRDTPRERGTNVVPLHPRER